MSMLTTLHDAFSELGTKRPDWDAYFLNLADAVSQRADCRRRKAGCVIVDDDNRVISTGFNGAEPGGPSCLAGECPRGLLSYQELAANVSYDNCVAVHAEANALLFARASCKGTTAYITSKPCPGCLKLLEGAGVARYVTTEESVLL